MGIEIEGKRGTHAESARLHRLPGRISGDRIETESIADDPIPVGGHAVDFSFWFDWTLMGMVHPRFLVACSGSNLCFISSCRGSSAKMMLSLLQMHLSRIVECSPTLPVLIDFSR